MRLFHVSEQADLLQFLPRTLEREDLDPPKGLVWAIHERYLPNFLAPRDCPRVTYNACDTTTEADITRFFSSAARHCVAIEHAWFERMQKTTLYLHEFNSEGFYLQDESAGYYVSERTETPIGKTQIDDLFGELTMRHGKRSAEGVISKVRSV